MCRFYNTANTSLFKVISVSENILNLSSDVTVCSQEGSKRLQHLSADDKSVVFSIEGKYVILY